MAVQVIASSYTDGPTLTAAAAASCVPTYVPTTLPAGYWQIGRMWRLRMSGRVSCAVTTPGTFRIDVRLTAEYRCADYRAVAIRCADYLPCRRFRHIGKPDYPRSAFFNRVPQRACRGYWPVVWQYNRSVQYGSRGRNRIQQSKRVDAGRVLYADRGDRFFYLSSVYD